MIFASILLNECAAATEDLGQSIFKQLFQL